MNCKVSFVHSKTNGPSVEEFVASFIPKKWKPLHWPHHVNIKILDINVHHNTWCDCTSIAVLDYAQWNFFTNPFYTGNHCVSFAILCHVLDRAFNEAFCPGSICHQYG